MDKFGREYQKMFLFIRELYKSVFLLQLLHMTVVQMDYWKFSLSVVLSQVILQRLAVPSMINVVYGQKEVESKYEAWTKT